MVYDLQSPCQCSRRRRLQVYSNLCAHAGNPQDTFNNDNNNYIQPNNSSDTYMYCTCTCVDVQVLDLTCTCILHRKFEVIPIKFVFL